MKKIITLFAVVVGLFAFSSCEGPEGPPGFDGQDGLIAEVIEVSGYSFDSNNGYERSYNFGAQIYPGDMVLVYRSVIQNGVSVWRALPESDFYSDGTVHYTYNYEFTRNFVTIFIQGFELNTIPNNERLNQKFRIVIIPGDGANLTSKKINSNEYNDITEAYNIEESQVKKVKIE